MRWPGSLSSVPPQVPAGISSQRHLTKAKGNTMDHNAKTVVLDLDGVIVDTAEYGDTSMTWNERYRSAALIPGARDAMEDLKSEGIRVIIHTARQSSEASVTSAWLEEHQITRGKHYDYLIYNKPLGDVYVDDRAMRFSNCTGGWDTFLEYLLAQVGGEEPVDRRAAPLEETETP